jgi:hypothetical protein
MNFKSAEIGVQYARLLPEVRQVLAELDERLHQWGSERLTITDAIRTPGEQEELYWHSYVGGGVGPEEARQLAREKFSWHLVGAAADFRALAYNAEERSKIWSWLHERCPAVDWELLIHDVGRGEHFHVAKRSHELRKQWEDERTSPGRTA